MICPVVTYAPTAATKPNIAAQPLKRSASGVMIKNKKISIWIIVTEIMKLCKVFFIFYLEIKVFDKNYAIFLQYCCKNVLTIFLCPVIIEKEI